jgi:MoxR-like ATPase
MGIKCSDIHAIYACSGCHAYIDGVNRSKPTTRGYILDALEETQLIMIDEGLIKL